MEIRVVSTMPTRPCRYCLSLQGDSVFADFDVEGEEVYLVRISFDGFGCCTIEPVRRKMDVKDSRRFIEMLETNDLIESELAAILSRYFLENKDLIWSDALVEHELLCTENC
jgi:hypothetical protein